MAFLRRLGWYLIGLSIGIVFLVFFLKKKSGEEGVEFCYLPNCRVLKNIRSKELIFSETVQKEILRGSIDSLTIKGYLEDGKVDFGHSDTQSKDCKTYRIIGEKHILTVKNCDEEATVVQFLPKPIETD